jgi:hypothetical protein
VGKEIKEKKELRFGPHNCIWLVNLNLKNENEKQEGGHGSVIHRS